MFNKSSISVAALVAALALPVTAHGVVEKLVIGGQDFGTEPVWQVDNNGPAATTNNMGNADLACGPGATAPSSSASATAGDTVEFTWSSSWPHTKGPVITYLGKCSGSSCDPNSIDFYKIDEKGITDDDGTWEQEKLTNGNPVSATIPTSTADGTYLIRNEIDNLGSIPQELYPSCSTIEITGGGSGLSGETISFPPGYSDADVEESIALNNIYSLDSGYTFPGPSVASRRAMLSPDDQQKFSLAEAGKDVCTASATATAKVTGKPKIRMDFVDFSNEVQRRPSTLSGVSEIKYPGSHASRASFSAPQNVPKPDSVSNHISKRASSLKPKHQMPDSEHGTLLNNPADNADNVDNVDAAATTDTKNNSPTRASVIERREEDVEKGDEKAVNDSAAVQNKDEKDPFFVEFTPGDPENPKNWKTWYKWHCTMLSSVLILNSTLASSIPSSALQNVMQEFGVSQETATVQITLFLFGYVVGPSFWAPVSEIWGRKPIFIITLFVYTTVTIGCALAPNITCLLICRLITGTAAASPLTNSGGVVTDIWPLDKLGIPLATFACSPFLGPVLGPILGGFEAQYGDVGSSRGWQWTYYTCLIFGFTCLCFVIFFLPETYGPTIIERRAKKLRKETGDMRYYCASEKNRPPIGQLLKTSLTRPLRLQVTEPIVIFSSIYISIVYGVLYMTFEAFPLIFRGVQGFSVGISGLSFISIAIGIGFFLIVVILYDRRYQRVARETKKLPPVEMRLEPTLHVGSFAFAIGLWWLGWTGYKESIPWQAPMAAGIPLGFGIVMIFMSFLNYLASTYVTFSASALAANTITRSIVGAVCPLFVDQMFTAGALHCGIKKNGAFDLGILQSSSAGCVSAASFTQNIFKAAPVVWSSEVQHRSSGGASALIVNSGCANAVTGKQGMIDAQAMTTAVNDQLGRDNSTLVMSTGVIGQLLPIKRITGSIAPLFHATREDEHSWMDLARSFMTTDTFPKLRASLLRLPSGRSVRVAGIDKGAGMIHPHMGPPSTISRLPHGTLLGVIATDAPVSSTDLQQTLDHVVDRSFNSISVDGDMSTNDTVLAFANGAEGGEKLSGDDLISFQTQLTDFAIDLAQLVVRDGEGATKFVAVNVDNAPSYSLARQVARSVATSSLVKTALYGQDANWGRILCAVGYAPLSGIPSQSSDPPIDPSKVTVKFRPTDGSPDVRLLTNGEPETVDEARAAEVLKMEDLDIHIDLCIGEETARYWTCDLSHEYVTINGDYRS
ncbi:hypothetical protein E3P89_02435 [Wallemia ichthyophaga]|uniref:Arginine biosynthesis bifunctional protein ArgJ, mitochondrial n=1 Tax=Wallemia ichthyophaga TaxID=245174 RepID=A0A4V4LZ02_WALIC|nr:hypothetical protein E3P90_02529 [Wallemia ichthyophaga]TIB11984.1 hypothetical protein E3P93_02426 [Wallemia ichthyophaga]TIB21784.1 hypothetical protein E3P89_02435 [Wallemia ichthyophaga]TIB23461.1 hypothetical protein E3P88_02548 [Wallemia ichthyophaga]